MPTRSSARVVGMVTENTRSMSIRRCISAASLRRGKGLSGSSTPRNSHSGPQPSFTSWTSSRSLGTRRLTSSLCRVKTSKAWCLSSKFPSKVRHDEFCDLQGPHVKHAKLKEEEQPEPQSREGGTVADPH